MRAGSLKLRGMKSFSGTPEALEVGERVFLRAPALGDYEEFYALMTASRSLHRGFVAAPVEPAQFTSLVERCRQPNFESFFVCLKEGGALVGVFNLSEIVRGIFQSAYMGYYAGEPFAGRGLMTEAMQLVLRHTFDELKLHRVEANIQPRNTASLALARRAGFTREGYSRRYLKIDGRWRDHERWAILAEDWRAQKAKVKKTV